MFLAHPKLCNEIHTCYVITSTLKWGEIDCGCILAYFSQFLLLDVGLFFWQQDSWEKWEELPQVEISVLLLLTLKGAEEPALWHEISDFSKRDRPRWYYWKKKKSQKHIHPEYQSPEIIHITLQLWQETRFLELRHLKHFIVAVTATDTGDNNPERWCLQRGYLWFLFKIQRLIISFLLQKFL